MDQNLCCSIYSFTLQKVAHFRTIAIINDWFTHSTDSGMWSDDTGQQIMIVHIVSASIIQIVLQCIDLVRTSANWGTVWVLHSPQLHSRYCSQNTKSNCLSVVISHQTNIPNIQSIDREHTYICPNLALEWASRKWYLETPQSCHCSHECTNSDFCYFKFFTWWWLSPFHRYSVPCTTLQSCLLYSA